MMKHIIKIEMIWNNTKVYRWEMTPCGRYRIAYKMQRYVMI